MSPLRFILTFAASTILCSAQCPSTIFVSGNNEAASKMREELTNSSTNAILKAVPQRSFLKLVGKKEDAAAVLQIDQAERDELHVAVSASLTLTSGDLVWSKSTTKMRGCEKCDIWHRHSDGPWGASRKLLGDLQKQFLLCRSTGA